MIDEVLILFDKCFEKKRYDQYKLFSNLKYSFHQFLSDQNELFLQHFKREKIKFIVSIFRF